MQESRMLRSEPSGGIGGGIQSVADNEPVSVRANGIMNWRRVQEIYGDMQENEPEGGNRCYLSLLLSFLNARMRYLR